MTLVDAHVHLMSYPEVRTPIRVARAAPMCLFSCTVGPSEVARNLEAARENKGTVRSFVGVHPSEVTAEAPSRTLGPFFDACDGIGEIGLDEKYSPVSEGSPQLEAFIDQLRVAERLGKPVQVHSRGSEKKCLELLGTFKLRSVLMHWFEGEVLVPEVVSRGYLVSVGPALIYSKKIRRIAASVPRESLLTESDGPVPYGPLGGASGPSLVPSVLLGLAEIKGASYETMEEQVEANSRRFLGVERLI